MLEGDFDIPVLRGDLADTWIRGVGSAPAGASMLRGQRPVLSTLESITALKKMKGMYASDEDWEKDRAVIRESYEKMLLFGEHTWSMDTKVTILPERTYGAPWIGFKFWESGIYNKKLFEELKTKDPGYLKLQESWQEQLDYIRVAYRGIENLKNGPLKSLAESVDTEGERLVVGSTLGWRVRQQVVLEDNLPKECSAECFIDLESKEKSPVYLNHEGKRCIDVALPSLGYKTLKSAGIEEHQEKSRNVRDIAKQKDSSGVLENCYLKIEVDKASGCITSLYHKPLKKEWVNKKSALGFGQYVYDIFGSKELQKYLCDYSYVLRDWGVNDFGKAGYPKDQQHLRFTPQGFDLDAENGFNWGKLTLTAAICDQSTMDYGNAQKVRLTVVMYEDKEYVDLKFDLLNKLETPLIESGHFAFPLSLENPRYMINKLGSVIDPEKDIVAGCNRDLHCLEKWVDISNGECGMAVISYDMPLLSFCEPGILMFNRDFSIKEPTLLMHAFNNGWGTNFPQWIGGDLGYRYRIVPHMGEWKHGEIWKSAEEALKAAVISYSEGQKNKVGLPSAADLMVESAAGFVILAFKPSEDGEGYVLRMGEVKGEAGKNRIKLALNIKEAFHCDLLERKAVPAELIRENQGCSIEFYSREFEIITFYLNI
jgi:alpha-mannosidase